MKIVSRGEVAERLQCMSDWGFNNITNEFVILLNELGNIINCYGISDITYSLRNNAFLFIYINRDFYEDVYTIFVRLN